MFRFSFATRICIHHSSRRKYGFKPSEYNPTKTIYYLFNTSIKQFINTWPLKLFSLHNRSMGNIFYRNNSTEAAVKENNQTKTYFQQQMLDRKNQSQRSVLVEISKKEDIPYALNVCYKFGKILTAYSYPGESNNCFLLLEFLDEAHVQNLLINCQCRNITDAFPVFSRLLQFQKKFDTNLPNVDCEIIEEDTQISSFKNLASVSDLIEYTYSCEKLSELNTRLRYFFCALIRESLSGLFPYCDVFPFGSSINGIGRHGCDLDLMIRLYPEQVKDGGELYFASRTCVGDLRALQQRTIFCLGDFIKTFFPGISSMQKIIHARIPILKFKHRILKMECDISINNMSAILMTEIIHFCGEIDPRIRPLLYSVKKWAKESEITYSAPGTYITNFGLTNLVLFFLQNRPVPILPPFNDALVILGEETSSDFRLQYLKPIEGFKISASLNKESLAVLLKEFLQFLGTYPFKNCTISLMSGKGLPRKNGNVLCIQYPFEEDLNITKNVSEYEFWDMTEKARISAKYLENNLNHKISHLKDFGNILGISNLKKLDASKLKKIDVGSLLDDQSKSSKTKLKRRIS